MEFFSQSFMSQITSEITEQNFTQNCPPTYNIKITSNHEALSCYSQLSRPAFSLCCTLSAESIYNGHFSHTRSHAARCFVCGCFTRAEEPCQSKPHQSNPIDEPPAPASPEQITAPVASPLTADQAMVVTACKAVAHRMRNRRGAARIRFDAMERRRAREREASVVVPRFTDEGEHGCDDDGGLMSVADSLDSNAPIADVMNAVSDRVWRTILMIYVRSGVIFVTRVLCKYGGKDLWKNSTPWIHRPSHRSFQSPTAGTAP